MRGDGKREDLRIVLTLDFSAVAENIRSSCLQFAFTVLQRFPLICRLSAARDANRF